MNFTPGVWEQDKYTLPLETAIVAALHPSAISFAHPAWPFNKEFDDLPFKSSTHPANTITLIGFSSTLLTYGALSLTKESFPLWPHTSGFLHTIALTGIFNEITKLGVQRHRPYFETLNTSAKEDVLEHKLSFFSGHSSHTFAMATYLERVAWHHISPLPLRLAFSLTSYGLASWVAITRVSDHKHHLSDVIVGSLVGFTVAQSIFYNINTRLSFDEDSISLKFKKDI